MAREIYRLRIKDEDEEIEEMKNLEEGEQYYQTGVGIVSLVDEPAMGYSYQLFDKDKELMKFNVEDEEKRLVSGVLLLANTPIYRFNFHMGEHYIVFEKDTIRKIMQKFFKKNYHLKANFNHMEATEVDNVYFYESFQVDEERGIQCPVGYNLPDGSWFGTLKVEDDALWEEIKNGSFTGFSVEGFFDYQEFGSQLKDDIELETQLDTLIRLLDKI